MQRKYTIFIFLSLFVLLTLSAEEGFISTHDQLQLYSGLSNTVMIASPGRSASTMLTEVMKKYATHYRVLKTHLLPPSPSYTGKILFIFSNPDKAAESALHRVLISPSHGRTHFSHVETADQNWFKKIGRNASHQTEEYNLLAYDALGYAKQLEMWLDSRVRPCPIGDAQILAIKFEHLWDAKTIKAIKKFLKLQAFELPPKIERGCNFDELLPQEIIYRSIYNEGTDDEPRYLAYDKARSLWENAPPYRALSFRR